MSTEPTPPAPEGVFCELPYERLIPDPFQARGRMKGLQQLAESIRQHGLLENLVVSRAPDGSHFEIKSGERRWRAIDLLRKEGFWPLDKPIPCLLIGTDGLLEALSANLQRDDVEV